MSREDVPRLAGEDKEPARASGGALPREAAEDIRDGGDAHHRERSEHQVSGVARAGEAGVEEREPSEGQGDEKNGCGSNKRDGDDGEVAEVQPPWPH